MTEPVRTIAFIGADVSTVAGIDQAATQLESAVDHLDALVNNAGVMIPTRQTTSEGAELNLAVHHRPPHLGSHRKPPRPIRPIGPNHWRARYTKAPEVAFR